MPQERTLKRNAIQCRLCGDVIESKHRHDFKYCSCRAIFIDGGLDYSRMGGEIGNMIYLHEYYETKPSG